MRWAIAVVVFATVTVLAKPLDAGSPPEPSGPTLSATNFAADLPLAAPTGVPGWSDEFDRPVVDPGKWRFATSRNAAGWYNEEQQYYAGPGSSNTRIVGGTLFIEARRERPMGVRDSGGQRYTSAKLVSRRALGYGFYEVRAKLPCGRGGWPAIWLLPPGGTWPGAGEIDIMEMVGWQPGMVHATVHSEQYNHARQTQRGARRSVPDACTAFHRYQLDWRPDAILIGIDDRAFFRVTNDRPGDHGAWPFTRPYQLILNIAVGGTWGGAKGIDDAAFPQRMQVDYVRHWPTR